MREPRAGDVWQSSNGDRWRCDRELGFVRPHEPLREWTLIRTKSKRDLGRRGQFGDDFVVRHWTLVKL